MSPEDFLDRYVKFKRFEKKHFLPRPQDPGELLSSAPSYPPEYEPFRRFLDSHLLGPREQAEKAIRFAEVEWDLEKESEEFRASVYSLGRWYCLVDKQEQCCYTISTVDEVDES